MIDMTANASAGEWPGAVADWARKAGPGIVAALTIAAAANFVAITYGGPIMLMALLIGIALNFLSDSPRAGPGLVVASKNLVKIGVALLGLRVSSSDVIALGADTIAVAAGAIVFTIAVSVLLARKFGRSLEFGVLAGGATAICGASAALAIGSALPKSVERDREIAFVIVAVTTLSTIAMVVYPVIAHLLGFDDRQTGILLGATIHDVAQVVGAGYAVSDEAGDTATVVKLFRVAMLLPAVFLISGFFARRGAVAVRRSLPVPLFAIVFGIFVVLNSLGLVSDAVRAPLIEFSRWCLVAAVAAIGVRTSIPEMLKMGRAAIAVPLGATVLLLALVVSIEIFLT